MITQNLNTGHSFGHCAYPHLVLQPFGCSFSIMSTVKEVWKPISGFNEYFISNLGRVRSTKMYKNGIVLKQFIDQYGYPCVWMYKNKKRYKKLVHRLVSIAFIPNPSAKPTVNHIDFNKQNNNVSNLEWCTFSENYQHSFKAGRLLSGEDHKMAKLTEEEVLQIRAEYVPRKASQRFLARKYNVSQGLIHFIVTGKLWSNI